MPNIVCSRSVCAPLLNVGSILFLSTIYFQVLSASYIFEHVAFAFIQFHTIFDGDFFRNPLLGICFIAAPLQNIGTQFRRISGNAQTAGILCRLGGNSVGTVCILYKFKELCIRLGIRPDSNIGTILRISICKIQVVGLAISYTGTYIIISVSGIDQLPGISGAFFGCALLYIGTIFCCTVCNFQIQTAADIPEHVLIGCVHSIALLFRRHRLHAAAQNRYIRTSRKRLIGTEIKTCMRRLIVRNVLSSYLIPILWVMHQGSNPVIRIISGRINPYRFSIRSTYNQFFPPVAKQIRRQARRSLCGITSIISIRGKQCFQCTVLLHFGNRSRRIGVAI